MTDEAKALVEKLRWSHWYYEDAGENTSYTSEAPLEAADLIGTQAREIERLRVALPDDIDLFRIIRRAGRSDREKAQAVYACIRAALAGDSHDQ